MKLINVPDGFRAFYFLKSVYNSGYCGNLYENFERGGEFRSLMVFLLSLKFRYKVINMCFFYCLAAVMEKLSVESVFFKCYLNQFSCGLTAVEDFVLHDLYQLAAFAEQQPTSERLKEVGFWMKPFVIH